MNWKRKRKKKREARQWEKRTDDVLNSILPRGKVLEGKKCLVEQGWHHTLVTRSSKEKRLQC